MTYTIYAAFPESETAERAAGALLDHGVDPKDLTVVRSHHENSIAEEAAYKTGHLVDNAGEVEYTAKEGITTTTAADAGAGAVQGAGWGAGIGAIAALTSLVVPGVGLVLGGGALATAIAGLAATAGGGAIAGAVTGYLKDQGVDEGMATEYERVVGTGGAIVAVSLPSNGVDEIHAREVIAKYDGALVNSYQPRSYMA